MQDSASPGDGIRSEDPPSGDPGVPGRDPAEAAPGAEAGEGAGEASGEVSGQAAVLAAMAAADPEAARALQADWGENLAENLGRARRAAQAFASPGLIRALEDSGLGDHPALIRVAAEVGRLLDSAAGPASAPRLDGAALESLEAEIDRLHALQFARPQEYRSERTQRALARLYARRYGGGPGGPGGWS